MTATLSKRNQARNERVLQELIKTVPGNDRCADCQARNPGWASWSLGIFLCMRCAALHRKLGTHISKVKSLSMDTWSNDQVDNMKRNGNTISNRTYNPHNKKPTIPLDVDEIDSAMERYMRQKYEQGVFSGKPDDTGSTGSSEEHPPPLPPKPTRRFGLGLRAASSTFPISRYGRDKEYAPALQINSYASPHSELRINKQSRVFGTSLGDASNTELKLATLRDMGFPDDRRNLNVLKGLGGNLERAIESLVRLGEGTSPRPRSTSTQARIAKSDEPIRSALPWNDPTSRSHFTKSEVNPGTSDNIQGTSSQQNTGQYESTNKLTSTSTGTSQNSSYNPFETTPPHSSTFPLESTFEGLQVSQPLFPNATGGYPSQQQQQQAQEARFQQPMTPPVPRLPYQHVHTNPVIQSRGGSYNPFLQQLGQPPLSAPANALPLFVQQYGSANPYGSQLYNHIQSQQFPQSAPPQQQQHISNSANPLDQQATTSQQQQYPDPNISQTQAYQQFMDQSQALYSQQIGRMDKRSILDLYNYPQLAPPPPVNNFKPATDVQTRDVPASDVDIRPVTMPGQRSVTMPVQLSAGSKNPFRTHQATLAPAANAGVMNGNDSRHVSQDSTDYSREYQGRSSPDAFATLSSRFVR